MKKYKMVLKQVETAICRKQVEELLERLDSDHFSMVSIEGEFSMAYGFIDDEFFEEAFDFDINLIKRQIKLILDDAENENESCEYLIALEPIFMGY